MVVHWSVYVGPLACRARQRLELLEEPALLAKFLHQEVQLQDVGSQVQDKVEQEVRPHPHVVHGERLEAPVEWRVEKLPSQLL